MSLLSVPEQRSSSSHVRVVDEAWEKLYREKWILPRWLNHSQMWTLTLMFQLFRIECRLSTLVDDKTLLHHLSQSCHHTLSPIVHCYTPPVCQRSLLFGRSCLPASSLHLIVLYIYIQTQKLWRIQQFHSIVRPILQFNYRDSITWSRSYNYATAIF